MYFWFYICEFIGMMCIIKWSKCFFEVNLVNCLWFFFISVICMRKFCRKYKVLVRYYWVFLFIEIELFFIFCIIDKYILVNWSFLFLKVIISFWIIVYIGYIEYRSCRISFYMLYNGRR